MIDHNVMRLHVSVHNSLAVTKVQSLQQLENVESHIKVVELGIEASEVGIVDILENERRSLTLRFARDVPPLQSAHRNIYSLPIMLIICSPGSLARRQAVQQRWGRQPSSAES